MKVRLKVNVIAGGKNYPFDSVIDDAILPERMRTKEYVAYDLEDMGGKVMILREANFNVTRTDDDGVRTNYPVMRAAGELIERSEIPQGWVEGEDYRSSWSNEERRSVQEAEHQSYLKQFQTEQPEVLTGWRNK